MFQIVKKSVIAVLAVMCLLPGLPARSQNQSGSNSYWGLRAGLDVSLPRNDMKGYKNGAGLSFGAVFNNRLAGILYLEPSALLYYDTMGDDVKVSSSDYAAKASMREFGLRIPVNLGVKLDCYGFDLKLFTGPEFGYGFMCKEVVSEGYKKVKVSETVDMYE